MLGLWAEAPAPARARWNSAALCFFTLREARDHRACGQRTWEAVVSYMGDMYAVYGNRGGTATQEPIPPSLSRNPLLSLCLPFLCGHSSPPRHPG